MDSKWRNRVLARAVDDAIEYRRMNADDSDLARVAEYEQVAVSLPDPESTFGPDGEPL